MSLLKYFSKQKNNSDNKNKVAGTSASEILIPEKSETSKPKEHSVIENDPQPQNKKQQRIKNHPSVEWMKKYTWLTFNAELEKAFCSICCDAQEIGLHSHYLSAPQKRSIDTFVNEGYTNWRKASTRLREHEKSSVHQAATTKLLSVKKGVNVAAQQNQAKRKELDCARKCLLTILSSILYLAIQGIAIRGHIDESSNLNTLLELRANDVPELKFWLTKQGYNWLSHDIIKEYLNIIAIKIETHLAKLISESLFYAIMIDETSDISRKEQVSICFRIVLKDLSVLELFCGYYETAATNADTLYRICLDVIQRYGLDITKCRGQCYDGAANMSGHISGLQSRIRKLEPRALYVHCNAHSLNLVVQNVMSNIPQVRNILNEIKDLLTFIRDSPKRLAMFETLRNADGIGVKLRQFCPTRWVHRGCSLRSLKSNYKTVRNWLNEISDTDRSDVGAKAAGFDSKLDSFEFYFLLSILETIFYRIEIFHSAIQKAGLNFNEVRKLTTSLNITIRALKGNFEEVWNSILTEANSLAIQEPLIPRARKIPRRFDSGSAPHSFKSPKEFYNRLYQEILDNILNELNERFSGETFDVLEEFENFLLNKSDGNKLISFYANDFDKDRLILHRNMFWDILQQLDIHFDTIESVIEYLCNINNSHHLITLVG